MGKFRMLWFLLWHARCSDSLSWKMLVMMEGLAVYAGVKPDKARSLVMGLHEESPFLERVQMGSVLDAVCGESLVPRDTWRSRLLARRLAKLLAQDKAA